MAGRKSNWRVLRKPGGEPVSRALLVARITGMTSGLDMNLGEVAKAAAEVSRRTTYLLGDGALLLDDETRAKVQKIHAANERLIAELPTMRRTAIAISEVVRAK